MTRLEAFPGSMGVKPLRPKEGSARPSGLCGARIFLVPALRESPWSTSATVGLPFSVPPSLITPCSRCRNINLLSIAYGFRPRLRSRLTLGRLALPRNPWAFGGRVSRPSFVTHASILSPDPSTADKAYAAASLVTGCSPTTPESRDPPESAASVNDF